MNRIVKAGFREIITWLDFTVSYTPGRIGILLRRFVFKRKVSKSGRNVSIGIGVEVTGCSNIQTGDNISIMKHSSLYAHSNGLIRMGSNISINSNTCIGAADRGKIVIGNNVLIAQNVVLRASDHEFKSTEVPITRQGHTGGEITVGNDCWIGANVVVTHSVIIGDHSIVAAGAVVTANVDPFSIVAGVPARLVKRRTCSCIPLREDERKD